MKKQDIVKVLKKNGIDFEIYGSQKDKKSSCYELKLIKDKNTSLRTKINFNSELVEIEDIIKEFKAFDYQKYIRSIFNH